MKFGLTMFVTGYTIDIVTLAKQAEAMGFESLWLPEHPIIPVAMETPFAGNPEGVLPEFYKHTLDPFAALTAAATATKTLRIGTAICLVPERNALITAKEVATVDHISQGRFEFGIGAGWLREESEILGVDFPHRWGQTKDHILAMKACWGPDPSEYHGKYVDFPKLWCHPKPAQQPHPPILIAGEGERLASRIAEYGDGWIPRQRNTNPQSLEAGRKKVEQAMRDNGRDTDGFTVSLFGANVTRDESRDFFSAGTDRIILRLASEDEPKTLARMEELAGMLL